MDANIASGVGARLDRMPVTLFHHRLALFTAAGLLVDGIDVYITAGVSGALLQAQIATLPQIGQLAMWTTLGLIVGGALAGALADRFGRLRLMRFTIAIVIIGG